MILSYIGVGSNLGDREKNITRSREQLERRGIRILRVSPLYESEAVKRPADQTDHPPYLNGVFEIETALSPEELLNQLEEVERHLGRISKGDWSPRTIDLDILLYGDCVVDTDRLKVPHPEIQHRWFVWKPLRDLIQDKERLTFPRSSG